AALVEQSVECDHRPTPTTVRAAVVRVGLAEVRGAETFAVVGVYRRSGLGDETPHRVEHLAVVEVDPQRLLPSVPWVRFNLVDAHSRVVIAEQSKAGAVLLVDVGVLALGVEDQLPDLALVLGPVAVHGRYQGLDRVRLAGSGHAEDGGLPPDEVGY